MTRSWRVLAEKLRAALHLDDAPWRIALALAVGVFISCTPFWGLQTILAIVVAMIFRLNRAATVTGAWLNLPWFAPFIYAGALKVGALVMPGVQAGFKEMSLALLIGTTIVGLVAGAATYVIALGILYRRRARRAAKPPDADRRRAA